MVSKIWTEEDLRQYGLASDPEVHSITSAQGRHSESVDARFRSYALKMFLRVVCIVAALFTDGWVMWACIVAAGVLPWVAVVFANGEDRARSEDFSAFLSVDQQLALGQVKGAGSAEGERGSSGAPEPSVSGEDGAGGRSDVVEVIDGEVVEDSGR